MLIEQRIAFHFQSDEMPLLIININKFLNVNFIILKHLISPNFLSKLEGESDFSRLMRHFEEIKRFKNLTKIVYEIKPDSEETRFFLSESDFKKYTITSDNKDIQFIGESEVLPN